MERRNFLKLTVLSPFCGFLRADAERGELSANLIYESTRDPFIFIKDILGLVLRPWQRRCLQSFFDKGYSDHIYSCVDQYVDKDIFLRSIAIWGGAYGSSVLVFVPRLRLAQSFIHECMAMSCNSGIPLSKSDVDLLRYRYSGGSIRVVTTISQVVSVLRNGFYKVLITDSYLGLHINWVG